MSNKINFKYFSIQLICIGLLLYILSMEYLMIQHNRGQAMGISSSLYYIPLITLILLILFLLDRKQSNQLSIFLGLFTQSIFLGYFIYKCIFYYRVYDDMQYYKDNFDGYYSPQLIELGFVFFTIILIIFYSIYKIKIRNRNVNALTNSRSH